MRKILVATFFVVSLFAPYGLHAATQPEKRVAFIVGNSNYIHAPFLPNPKNDAIAISYMLKNLGFETVDGIDLTTVQFRAAVREFSKIAADADLSVFFYAGHGLAVDGINYMVPIDAKFEDSTALDFEAIPVDFIVKQMGYSGGVSLLFLDACRNNPLAANLSRAMGSVSRSTAISTGLAEMKIKNPGRGLAIAFATSPGEVALDGEGKHSPFTTALLNHLGTENTDISEIMGRVTGEVYEATGQAQRPWLNTSLTGPVILNAVVRQPATTANLVQTAPLISPVNLAQSSSLEIEKTAFQFAIASDRIGDYQAYLQTFPNGIFANFAKASIRRLEEEKEQMQLASLDPNGVLQTTPGSAVQNPALTATAGSNSVQPQDQSRALVQGGIMQLTPEQRALTSNSATERAMSMNWAKRREVQARLNLSGQDVGTADGAIGPKTRRGIVGWQQQQGFLPTGYLNETQVLYLSSLTQESYPVWLATHPAVAPQRRTGTKTTKSNSNDFGVFLGAIAAGILLSR